MPPWLWLIILFFAVGLLALLGVKGDASWIDFVQSPRFFDDLYGIVQLFVLEGRLLVQFGDTVPWPVRIAAFAAPVVTIFAFLQLVWQELSHGLSIGLYRFVYRNHVVVLGMGARGRAFVRDALETGKRVVAVDLDADAASQIPPRFRKFRFIRADAFNPHLVARTGMPRADVVVMFCGSGFANLSVAQHISAQIGALGRKPESWPRIICDATGSAQRDQIEADQLYDGGTRPQIEFYSPEEAAARELVTTHRPADFAAIFRRATIHVIVYGDTALAEAVVRQTVVLTQNADARQPRVTVAAQFSSGRKTEFEALARSLEPVARLELLEVAGFDDRFFGDEFQALAASASQHVVCLGSANANLDLGLRLHRETQAMADANLPVFVGPLGLSRGIAGRKAPHPGSSARMFTNNLLIGFGDVPNVLGWDYVVDQQQDELARRNHLSYLDQVSAQTQAGAAIKRPAALPWARLPERFRFSNRSFVDHLPAKLALIDHVITGGGAPIQFGQDQVETLARDEHNRWWAERLSMGWRFAETRDDKQRLHPDLVDWSKLPPATRDYDMALVRKIPELLAGTGKAARPVCRIGVSGHRDTNISRTNADLVRAIRKELEAIERAHPDHHFQIWSPLAEGADRLVAELAMQHLNASLHVPLPLPVADYCEDFVSHDGDDTSLRQFQNLLHKAAEVFELPIMDAEDAPEMYRKWQYAGAGAFVLQRCDEVILVWDGKPSDGFGGTGQIADWQQTGHIPGRLRKDLQREGQLAEARVVSFVRDLDA